VLPFLSELDEAFYILEVGGAIGEVVNTFRQAQGRKAMRPDTVHAFELPAHFFAAVDLLHDEDDQFLVLNRIDEAIVSFSNAIQIILSGKCLYALRARIFLQRAETFDDSLSNRLEKCFELSLRRRGEENGIGHRGKLEAKVLSTIGKDWIARRAFQFWPKPLCSRSSRLARDLLVSSPHYSRGFVTKPLRRVMRRARAAGKEGSILEPHVDRLSGESTPVGTAYRRLS